MEIPKGAKQPKFETTFILEKNGEQKEFTLDNYPDSTWTFIDSKTLKAIYSLTFQPKKYNCQKTLRYMA